jgi:hypothetical protein
MKLNKYTDSEIEALAPPSPTDATFIERDDDVDAPSRYQVNHGLRSAVAGETQTAAAASSDSRRSLRRSASASSPSNAAAPAPATAQRAVSTEVSKPNNRLPRYGGIAMRNDFDDAYSNRNYDNSNTNETKVHLKSHSIVDIDGDSGTEKRQQAISAAAMIVEKKALDRA